MATINGSSFLIYKDDDPIGHSNNATINLNCDLPDISTKDSNGWREVLASVRSGTVEVAGLTDYSDTVNFEQLADMVILRTSTPFYFSQDIEGYGDGLVIQGTGYIQSVDEEASVEAITNYNLTIVLTSIILIDERTGEVWNTDFDEWETANSNWEAA